MVKKNEGIESGFSLVELLIVVVILGILAAVGAGFFQRAKGSAENGSAYATMRLLVSSQLNFYGANRRYGRFNELNDAQGGAFGSTSGNVLTRGRFTFSMSPADPTDVELADGYTVIASKPGTNGDSPYVIQLSERGEIVQILP